ncbi:hypothetical protein Ddc_24138 [Ditylenchus destructor]|nr:hypothetical protein Ddc_24138 [Ditylenchus destructor]
MLNVAAADMSLVLPDTATRHGPSLPPVRVLVIDDEEPVRVAMHALLSAHGCQVLVAGSTREGLLKKHGSAARSAADRLPAARGRGRHQRRALPAQRLPGPAGAAHQRRHGGPNACATRIRRA